MSNRKRVMLNFPLANFIQQSYLQVKTDLDEIESVLTWFDQFKCESLSNEFILRAKIALIEGFTNAVRHAHQQQPKETPIDIYAFLYQHWLEIHIWDSGEPFDLESLLNTVEQQYPNPVEHEEHWGGTIFRKLSQDYGWIIQYNCPAMPQGDRNCLQIQMPFKITV